jgi:hypothetical protein
MYLDGVVILSLVVVILTCAIVVYVGIYAWKHIKSDVALDNNAVNPQMQGIAKQQK